MGRCSKSVTLVLCSRLSFGSVRPTALPVTDCWYKCFMQELIGCTVTKSQSTDHFLPRRVLISGKIRSLTPTSLNTQSTGNKISNHQEHLCISFVFEALNMMTLSSCQLIRLPSVPLNCALFYKRATLCAPFI